MNKMMVLAGAIIIVVAIVIFAAYWYVGKSSSLQQHPNIPYHPNYTNSTATTSLATTTVSNTTNHTMMEGPSVEEAYNASVGNYMTNSSGWTLYIYTADTQNSGNSTCYGSCAKYWPIFYDANITTANGINASAFGTITRKDGTKQTTYDGWPLYLYIGDHKAGDVKGQNVGDNWFVITLPKLVIPSGAKMGSTSTITSNSATTSTANSTTTNSASSTSSQSTTSLPYYT
jgi:predicted lipoprotein with Yx(FWY)xxD motif